MTLSTLAPTSARKSTKGGRKAPHVARPLCIVDRCPHHAGQGSPLCAIHAALVEAARVPTFARLVVLGLEDGQEGPRFPFGSSPSLPYEGPRVVYDLAIYRSPEGYAVRCGQCHQRTYGGRSDWIWPAFFVRLGTPGACCEGCGGVTVEPPPAHEWRSASQLRRLAAER